VSCLSLGAHLYTRHNRQNTWYFTRSHLSIRYDSFSTLETNFSWWHLLIVINILCHIHHAQYCSNNIYLCGPTPWLLQQYCTSCTMVAFATPIGLWFLYVSNFSSWKSYIYLRQKLSSEFTHIVKFNSNFKYIFNYLLSVFSCCHNIYHYKILLSHSIVLDNVVFIYELVQTSNDHNICCSMQTIIKITFKVLKWLLVIYLVQHINGQ